MRALAIATLCLAIVAAPAATAPTVLPDKAKVEALIGQGQTWLLAQQQADGAFLPGNQFAVGITAMAVEILSRPPAAIGADDPRMAKAIAFLKGKTQPDGGVYDPAEGLGNYGTSFTLMAVAAAQSQDAAWIAGMQRYLKGLQNQEPDAIHNGGIGYGSKGKGHEDLSNTSVAVAALRASGVPANDPALERALKFMERCQNLSSVNKAEWAGTDGGAVYAPDESKAGGSQDPKAGQAGQEPPAMTSYGSMTYALISSYLALELKPDDERLKAALDWVTRNYRFDGNPGMREGRELEGLFYYYAIMAKTFDTLDLKEVTLPDGTKADWRADLFAAISEKAIPADGGVQWMNTEKRWGESLPHLATVYMLRALKAIHNEL